MYPERELIVKASGVAVWDVLAAASRDESSLDTDIEDPLPNHIEDFIQGHPTIRSVFFNGAKAEQLFGDHVVLRPSTREGLRFVRLPSTSPANAAMSFSDKLEAWRELETAAREHTI
jgi:double-stranded uracil-DNA glycosylase